MTGSKINFIESINKDTDLSNLDYLEFSHKDTLSEGIFGSYFNTILSINKGKDTKDIHRYLMSDMEQFGTPQEGSHEATETMAEIIYNEALAFSGTFEKIETLIYEYNVKMGNIEEEDRNTSDEVEIPWEDLAEINEDWVGEDIENFLMDFIDDETLISDMVEWLLKNAIKETDIWIDDFYDVF